MGRLYCCQIEGGWIVRGYPFRVNRSQRIFRLRLLSKFNVRKFNASTVPRFDVTRIFFADRDRESAKTP